MHIPGNTGGLWPLFPEICKGITFIQFFFSETCNMILVSFSQFKTRDKTFPYPALVPTGIERIFMILPVIEISFHGNSSGIGCPYTEIHTPGIIHFYGMRTEFFI